MVLPFNALAIYLSANWPVTLAFAIAFPVVATTILKISEKKNIQPGVYIMSINGVLFLFYMYFSGPASPTWLSVINITVGSSFMFNRPLYGQVGMGVFAVMIGGFFWWMGADFIYCLIITLTLLSFVLLFSRAFYYMQLQQYKIEDKNREIENKNKDITDSINYARRIQFAVLPREEVIQRNIPLSFIYYNAKDIVSGDFFWFHEINRNQYIFVCADCTGHGVPGAFMTVIGTSLLNQTVVENKIHQPSKILAEIDRQINTMLKQQYQDYDFSVQDGMDLCLIHVDKETNKLTLASAKRPAIFIRNKELNEIKPTKFSIGGMRTGEKIFTETEMTYAEDDVLYLFTDGYTDQFGGEKAKKFSSKKLRELLLRIHKYSMPEQKKELATTIAGWQGNLEQIDDMLVVGIRF
ncbi:MAG: SpoIIE family protein phosphatase [Crocinitomicaceae bacterium]|nr:SpoIIE family protein phosphatase [Crocinitomicaceae bacterium]MBK8924560.1 SpoIIE family protein phosphatase [Crocinitomicaceae bacterium]